MISADDNDCERRVSDPVSRREPFRRMKARWKIESPLLEIFRRRSTLLVGLLLCSATFLIYWPATRHEFVDYDDAEYVVANPHVQSGLTWGGVAWAFRSGYASNWHPLTWLSHMLDVTLFGKNAGGHHFTNIAFHCINTVLLFLLLQRMTGVRWRSAFVAGFFALHPLQVESVAWVSERKDVLSTCFFLITLWAYARYAGPRTESRLPASRHPPCSSFYLLAVGCFALGLMSKPMLVTVPFVLLLLDYWPLRRFDTSNRRPLLSEKLPFFALTTASCLVTFLVQQAGGSVSMLKDVSFPMRLANALMSYAHYVGKTFWPVDLAVLYPRLTQVPAWHAAGAAMFLLTVTALVIWRRRRWPFATVGWLWFGGMLVPVIGLVRVGMQFMDDRYTYIPLIGLFIGIVWSADAVVNRWPNLRAMLVVVGILALAACAAITRIQIGFWANSEVLFGRAVAVTRDNYLAQNTLGMVLAGKGRFDEAIGHFQQAIRLAPNYPIPYNNLGNIAAKQGRLDEAIAHFRNAIRLGPKEVDAHHNLGNVLAAQRKFDEAVASYAEALRLDPNYAPAHFGLGNILLQQGKPNEAARQFEAALLSDPLHAEAHYRLGVVLSRQKQSEAAITHYRAAVRLKPDWVPPLNTLAWILATHPDVRFRNGPEAVRRAEHAAELTRNADAQILDTLAAAYAEAGRFAEATKTAGQALTIATAAGQKDLAAQIGTRLELYESRQSYHEL